MFLVKNNFFRIHTCTLSVSTPPGSLRVWNIQLFWLYFFVFLMLFLSKTMSSKTVLVPRGKKCMYLPKPARDTSCLCTYNRGKRPNAWWRWALRRRAFPFSFVAKTDFISKCKSVTPPNVTLSTGRAR